MLVVREEGPDLLLGPVLGERDLRRAAVRNVGSTIRASSCNVFWGNEGGDFRDWTPRPTDLFEDPLFCDWPSGDYTVEEESPCAPKAVCDGVAAEPESWARIKNSYRSGRR